MPNITTDAAPALTSDPVIAWLARVRDFVASSREAKAYAQQAIDRLGAADAMLQALREVAGDYIYLDPDKGREACVHCLGLDGRHEPECTMYFVFAAIAKAEGRS